MKSFREYITESYKDLKHLWSYTDFKGIFESQLKEIDSILTKVGFKLKSDNTVKAHQVVRIYDDGDGLQYHVHYYKNTKVAKDEMEVCFVSCLELITGRSSELSYSMGHDLLFDTEDQPWRKARNVASQKNIIQLWKYAHGEPDCTFTMAMLGKEYTKQIQELKKTLGV